MQLKIKIGGTDRSASVETRTVKIENVMTQRVDTCSFLLRDTTGSVTIDELDELIISNVAETVRYFGGYITRVRPDRDAITKTFDCGAQDYGMLLDGVVVNEVYEDKTDKQILQDLFSGYLSEITTADHVEDGLTNARIVFYRVTLLEAINMLAAKSGFDWYVDYFKKLHYFAMTSNDAPFGLSDSPDDSDTFPYSDLEYERDATRIVNMVTVVGGTYFSDDADFEGEANGVAVNFLLPYRLHPPDGETKLLVYKNTGTDETPVWTAQGVGIDYIDTLGGAIDVLHNLEEKLLRFNTAPSDLNRAIKITGQYEVPVLMRARSQASRDLYGRWMEDVIVNKDIDDLGWARAVGKSVLAESAFVKERGKLVCTRDGLVAGQRVPLKNTLRGIDGYYLINKVTTTILGGTSCKYKVHFGEYNPDLIDMLTALKARAKPHQGMREDEVLTDLLSQEEELVLAEAVDFHSDAFPPNVSRWIVLPPTQGVGHHIRHEALAVAEDTAIDAHATEDYPWDENAEITYWDFFTWA